MLNFLDANDATLIKSTYYGCQYVEESLEQVPLVHNATLLTGYYRVLSTQDCVNLEMRWVEYPESWKKIIS